MRDLFSGRSLSGLFTALATGNPTGVNPHLPGRQYVGIKSSTDSVSPPLIVQRC